MSGPRVSAGRSGPFAGVQLDYGTETPAALAAARRRAIRFDPATDGTAVIYPNRDGDLINAMQDCFADEEVAAHLANCHPGKRRKLAAVFARLRERDLAGWDRATPAQRAITWGDCWTHHFPETGVTGYGYVLPLAAIMDGEFAALCRPPAHSGRPALTVEQATPRVQQVVDHIKENHARGWRSGPGFSVLEPGGEDGYSHVCTLSPCSRQEFRAAAAMNGWHRALDLVPALDGGR
jgi:hypothetical protein